MNFTHCNYLGDLELNKKETNGIRLYNLPNGDWVPSITSVTSFYNRQIFADWRELVLKKQTALQNVLQPGALIFMRLHKHIS